MIIQIFVEVGTPLNYQIAKAEQLLREAGFATYTNEITPYATLEDAEIDMENK